MYVATGATFLIIAKVQSTMRSSCFFAFSRGTEQVILPFLLLSIIFIMYE